MPQLHFYVSEPIAEKIQQRARMAELSVSRYVAQLVQQEIGDDWPSDFFETVVGGWAGAPLQRPPQGIVEERDALQIVTDQ